MQRSLIIALGVVALTWADLSSPLVLLRIIFPIMVFVFISYQFIDFCKFLIRENVLTGSEDDNFVELLTALYADRKYRYEEISEKIPVIGWLFLELLFG